MAAFKLMLEQQTRSLIEAHAEQLAIHTSVLVQHTRALVEQVQERGQSCTDSNFARAEELMEQGARVREERSDAENERRMRVKDELRDALGDSRPQPEETVRNVAECRVMVGQLRRAGDGNVGYHADSSRPSASTGDLFPRLPPVFQSMLPVSDDEYPEHHSAPSGSSVGPISASEAGRKAREPKKYHEKVPSDGQSSVTFDTAAVVSKVRPKVVREVLSDDVGLSPGEVCGGVGVRPRKKRRPHSWVEDHVID